MHQLSVLASCMSPILLTLGSQRCIVSIYLVLPADQPGHTKSTLHAGWLAVHVQHTSEPSASLSELSSAADKPQSPIRRLCTQTGRLVLQHRQAAPASWCMKAC